MDNGSLAHGSSAYGGARKPPPAWALGLATLVNGALSGVLTVTVPQLLAAGAADMGIDSNAFGVMNLAQEKVPVKAVVAGFQKDPQVLVAHPGGGVNSLERKSRRLDLSP